MYSKYHDCDSIGGEPFAAFELSTNAESVMTTDQLTATVLTIACEAVDECMTKINHCLGQLSDEQVWWRPREDGCVAARVNSKEVTQPSAEGD